MSDKHKHESSSSSDSEDDRSHRSKRKHSPASSSSEDERKTRKRREKKAKRSKKEKREKKEKKHKKHKKEKKSNAEKVTDTKTNTTTELSQPNTTSSSAVGPALPPGMQRSVGPQVPQEEEPAKRRLGPMRPEEYAKLQERVREVYDEKSGRYRLVKGDGEIIERIVTKQQQQEIIKTVLKHAKYL
jgi:hypothetical protein